MYRILAALRRPVRPDWERLWVTVFVHSRPTSEPGCSTVSWLQLQDRIVYCQTSPMQYNIKIYNTLLTELNSLFPHLVRMPFVEILYIVHCAYFYIVKTSQQIHTRLQVHICYNITPTHFVGQANIIRGHHGQNSICDLWCPHMIVAWPPKQVGVIL
jgi:hypothetical protein